MSRRITYCVSVCVYAGLFGDILTFGLRGEGRKYWEVDLRYGVKKNHMFTLDYIELIFWPYIIPLYIYLGGYYI